MEFTILINAPREKVWNTLWNDVTYRQWTAPFGDESHAEGDWEKGNKILFLGSSNKDGMVSMIAENIPNEYMSIRHLGIVKNGVEDTESEEAKKWGNAFENYRLEEVDGKTKLDITLTGAQLPKEFEDFFLNAWPAALQKLKELCEKQ
ncbi:MAG: SRPBCC family protein [Agriterribacter sp.]